MSKLQYTDQPGTMVIFDDEINEIISTEGVDRLINYKFRNKLLMAKIWKEISRDPYITEIPRGRLFCYLFNWSYTSVPEGVSLSEIKEFWDLPGVIGPRIYELLSKIDPSILILIEDEVDSVSQIAEKISVAEKYSECLYINKMISTWKSKLEILERKMVLRKSEELKKLMIDNHKIPLNGLTKDQLVTTLLVFNGYKGSIYQAKKLELLLWLSTGLVLTDIIDTITKFIKVKDEVVCSIDSRFLTSVESTYDSDNFGLAEDKIYRYYKSECIRLGKEDGRLLRMYPGYSLANLKSTIKSKLATQASVKVSEYEILRFIEDNLTSKFEWDDVKNYMNWMNKYGIKPILNDEGEGYVGISFDNDRIMNLNRILLRYDKSELIGIRKVLAGIFDDSVRVTRLTSDDIINFDNDLACQMINCLVDWESIKTNQLMADLKWLMLIGHIGITLRKVDGDSYRIFFNTVNFAKVTELISKSTEGYNTALRVLNRLGAGNKFYREVVKNFNPAIWNLHKCQVDLIYR